MRECPRALEHGQLRAFENAHHRQLVGPRQANDLQDVADLRVELAPKARTQHDLSLGADRSPGDEVLRGELRLGPRLDASQQRGYLTAGTRQPQRHAALNAPGGLFDLRPGADIVQQRLGQLPAEPVPDGQVGESGYTTDDVPD